MRLGLTASLILALSAAAPTAAWSQAPDTGADNALGDRIRASAEAAESLQGPLDGGWSLISSGGQALYVFELVDKPGGQAPLEGVWRDLRKATGPGDIGAIDSFTRGVDTLSLSFFAKPGDPAVTVDLKNAAGAWTGQLHEGGATTDVTLRRN